MNDHIICFTRGLSLNDAQKGHAAFLERTQGVINLSIIPVMTDMLAETVGNVLGATLEQLSGTNETDFSSFEDAPVDDGQYRVVIILVQDKERVLQVMRSFKQVLPDPQDVIFAMITRDALAWTFEEYFDHLAKEHEYMKTHSPAHDSDMKRM